MENVMTLNAEPRQDVGKKIAKKLRKQGRIPAIIYGEHKESIPISLAVADIKAILKSETGENTVLRIHRENIQVDAMLKEIQYDYLSDNIIHADLIRIDLTKAVNINVPVTITGEPVGVKVDGGIFDFMTRELKVRCLPTQIPKEFVIDVSGLHTGDSIKVEDIETDEGIKMMSDSHTVICAVSMKGAIEEIAEEEGEEEAGEAGEAEETTAEDTESKE
jgi:large subunit ribosomal protein L25